MSKINCNCLEEMKKNLEGVLPELAKKNTGKNYKKQTLRFENVPLLMFDGGDSIPFMIVSYNVDGVKKDYKTSVMMNHCPFCGEKYTD